MKRLFVVIGVMAVMLMGCTEKLNKNNIAYIEAQKSCNTAFVKWQKINSFEIIKTVHFNINLNACLIEYLQEDSSTITRRAVDIFNGERTIFSLIVNKKDDPYFHIKAGTHLYSQDGNEISSSDPINEYTKNLNEMFEINR